MGFFCLLASFKLALCGLSGKKIERFVEEKGDSVLWLLLIRKLYFSEGYNLSLESMKIDLNLAIYRYKKFNPQSKYSLPQISPRESRKLRPQILPPRINNLARNHKISAEDTSIGLQNANEISKRQYIKPTRSLPKGRKTEPATIQKCTLELCS